MAQRYELFDENGEPTNYGASMMTDSDIMEAAKMAVFTPRVQGQEQAPWWQSVVQYGLVKAIDNTLPGQSRGIQGNTNPGTFAGQNGQTYSQTGPINAPPQALAGQPAAAGMLGGKMMPLLLIGAAVAAFIAFKR